MQQDIISLRVCIDHSSSIQAISSVAQAASYLKKTGYQYAAVLHGSKVIGLTTPRIIENLLASDHHKKLVANDCFIQKPIICSTNVSIEHNINYALSRSDEQLLDDIIVIDEAMDFVGLISAKTLLRLQRRYYANKKEQHELQIQGQRETICDFRNDLKIAQRQLAEHRLMVSEIKALRSAFISRFSHEARTPMTSIQGMLDLLQSKKMPDEQKRMIQAASSSTHTLLRLIQSTQDFAQIENDSIQLNEKTFSPSKALRACLLATNAEAEEKGLIIELEHHEIPDYVIGDASRFKQVIENLIGKAIDHTASGGVRIVATEKERRGKLMLCVEITDTSNGWEPAEADHLFHTHHSDQAQPICDIGTLVAERIINKLGGNLTCSYSEGKGSRFILELPMNVLSPLTKTLPDGTSTKLCVPSTPELESNEEDTPLNVLIIDDNSINLDVAQQFLEKLNCKVYLATGGHEGIEKLRSTPIDCVFLDCRMPNLSGYDTAKLIRRGQAGAKKANVFISAMTAHTTNKARKECFDSGMNYFIPKPISKRNFINALNASKKQREEPIPLFNKAEEAAG